MLTDMRRIFTLTLLLAASVIEMQAQTAKNVVLKKDGTFLYVKMDLDLQSAKPRANEAVVVVPQVKNGSRVADLQPVGLYSHNMWYNFARKGKNASGDVNELQFRGHAPETVEYETRIPYQSWMNGASLVLEKRSQGCCGKEKNQTESTWLASFEEELVFAPADTVQIRDTVEVKVMVPVVRSVSGRAFLDYPVNSILIDPNYHSNSRELGYVRASLDSVRTIPGAKIRKVWIKGYASPEGPYERNHYLALHRTQALKDYVVNAYGISEDLFEVEFVAENWDDFREYVAASSLQDKEEILKIVDSDRTADDKEALIKRQFPRAWATLRAECLPFLRRTDYRVDYEIVDYE
ncbi:MAG: hypothetical protein E7109_06070 [Bacteroidales bacterium]|jgi:hypothetical protein|nr:hypothetical protein [Bacteroidales bacterium]